MAQLLKLIPRETTPGALAHDVAAKYGRERRHLIRMLQEIQSTYGYLPQEALRVIANELRIPLTEVLTVATFYHQFRLEKPGEFIIMLCMGTACHLRGNAANYEFLRTYLGIKPGRSTTSDGVFSVEKARCFGCCSLAPVVMIVSRDGSYRKLYGGVTPAKLRRIIAEHRAKLAKKR